MAKNIIIIVYLIRLCTTLVCWRCFDVLGFAILDQGRRSRDQWIQAILLVESFKLVPRTLDEGPRPKSGILGLNLHGTCFGGKINWFRTKKTVLKESSRFGESRIRLATKVYPNSRIQFASNESKLVPRKLDPRLKWALLFCENCS
jgi:hypothetical protein